MSRGAVRGIALAGALLALLATIAPAATQVRSGVIAGGADSSRAGGYRLVGTLGQGLVGTSNGGGRRARHGYWGGGTVATAGVTPDEPAAATGYAFAVGPATPNPSPGRTSFAITLPRTASVSLQVFDVAGRRVGPATDARFGAGRRTLTWTAPATQSGVLFARVLLDGRPRAERRFVIVR